MDTARDESTASANPFGRLGELPDCLPDIGSVHLALPDGFHSQSIPHAHDIAAAAQPPQVAPKS